MALKRFRVLCMNFSESHFASFYLPGDFVPHVRIMNWETNAFSVYTKETDAIFRRFVEPGQEVEYGQKLGVILDPFTAEVEAEITCPTSGVVFFALKKTADNRT